MDRQVTLSRYSRQMLLSDFGYEVQEYLRTMRVLVVGAGGIGSTVIMYLHNAGIPLTIMDHDCVEESNLHRQILHDTRFINQPKVISAQQKLLEMNPHLRCEIIQQKISTANASEIIKSFDLVIDATDNFESRYIINDACVFHSIPLITASAISMEGQIMMIIPKQTPCYRCIHPKISVSESCRSCNNSGVLGPIPGLFGCLQAIEAIKFLVNKYHTVKKGEASLQYSNITNNQLFYDGSSGFFHSFRLTPRNNKCEVCGDQEFQKIFSLSDTQKYLDDAKSVTLKHTQAYIQADTSSDNKDIHMSVQDFFSTYQNLLSVKVEKPIHLIIDVRSIVQFSMATLKLPGNSVIFKTIDDCMESFQQRLSSSCSFSSSNTNTNSITDKTITSNAATATTTNYGDTDGNCSSYDSVIVNIPLAVMQKSTSTRPEAVDNNLQSQINQLIAALTQMTGLPPRVFTLCRRGIDSQVGCHWMRRYTSIANIYSIEGGLEAYKREIDPDMPMY